MSQYVAIARPYATALFDVVEESQSLDLWQQVLQVLSELAAEKSFLRLAQQPDISSERVVDLAVACVKGCVELNDADEEILRLLISSLAVKKRLIILIALEQLYSIKLAEKKQVINVDVTSADVMSEEQKKKMIAALKRRFDSEVNVSFEEDKDLIGGAVIRAGTWVMDGSIRQKLNKLKECIRG